MAQYQRRTSTVEAVQVDLPNLAAWLFKHGASAVAASETGMSVTWTERVKPRGDRGGPIAASRASLGDWIVLTPDDEGVVACVMSNALFLHTFEPLPHTFEPSSVRVR